MNLKTIFCGLVAFLLILGSAPAQILAGRAIQITISGVPSEEKARVDGIYPVSDAGLINMPFIGNVRAAGLRPDELQSSLQARYRNDGIYTNPTIQVIASSAGTVDEEMVHVGGQVRRAGPVKFTPGLTLYQAVQAAGGASEFGTMRRVKLFRGGNQKQYDLTQSQFMRIPLEPKDTIEVPDKNLLGR